MQDDIIKTTCLIEHHLQENGLLNKNANWEIKTSPLGGRGLFAKRDIQAGELIFIDFPLILGPRSGIHIPLRCVICSGNTNLKDCSKGCGLTICSVECENNNLHERECNLILKWKTGDIPNITRYLSQIRANFLNEKQKELLQSLINHDGKHQGSEVNELKKLKLNISEKEEILMRLACSVMDANAFVVVTGNEEDKCHLRGLYPLSGLANHRCFPNATHVFNEKRQIVVKAATPIKKGEEIFHSYVRIIWSTTVRRYKLENTKHFSCSCNRCADPTEFNTNLSGLYCQKCSGIILPEKPLNIKSNWKCRECNEQTSYKQISFLLSVFGSRLNSFQSDVEEMLRFLDKKFLPKNNHILVEIKLKIIWTLGHVDGYNWKELSDEHLNKKEVLCREILQLLEDLQTGRCKMRALLLYEICCCLRERHRRIKLQMHPVETNNNYSISEHELMETEKYLLEAAEILEDDVSMPSELRSTCRNK